MRGAAWGRGCRIPSLWAGFGDRSAGFALEKDKRVVCLFSSPVTNILTFSLKHVLSTSSGCLSQLTCFYFYFLTPNPELLFPLVEDYVN